MLWKNADYTQTNSYSNLKYYLQHAIPCSMILRKKKTFRRILRDTRTSVKNHNNIQYTGKGRKRKSSANTKANWRTSWGSSEKRSGTETEGIEEAELSTYVQSTKYLQIGLVQIQIQWQPFHVNFKLVVYDTRVSLFLSPHFHCQCQCQCECNVDIDFHANVTVCSSLSLSGSVGHWITLRDPADFEHFHGIFEGFSFHIWGELKNQEEFHILRKIFIKKYVIQTEKWDSYH